MDTEILWRALGIAAQIVGVIIVLIKFRNSIFTNINAAFVFALFCGMILPIQILFVINLFAGEGGFEPRAVFVEESSIQDPASEALIPLLTKQDFPDSWQWISASTQQPSEFPWKGAPADSAEFVLIAKAPHWLIFRHYVRVFQWTAFYETPVTEEDFLKRVSTSAEEASFVPEVKKAGKYFSAICHPRPDHYTCHASIGYEHHISSMQLMTPRDLGKQFLADLINSSVEVIDSRSR